MTTCSFKDCPRAATARGLCPGHYRQQLRGRVLTPLRGRAGRRGAEPLEPLTVWLAPASLARLDAQGPTRAEAARSVLDAWAAQR